jgi:hypothetical protein
LAKLVGDAELELRGIDKVARELDRNGIVKPERLADLGTLRGGSVESDHLVHGVAGEAEHRK